MAMVFNESEVLKCMEEQLEEGKDHVRVVVIGDIDVGKSSLMNLLLDKKMAEVSEGGDPGAVKAVITEYGRSIKYKGKVYKMTVVDSPGFGDPDEEKEFNILCDYYLKGCDLMVYCISAVSRIKREIINTLKKLNKARGEELWKKALIVFTRVNNNKQFNQEAWEKALKEYVPEISESAHFANSGDEEGVTLEAVATVNKKASVCWLYVTCGGVGVGGSAGLPALAQLLMTLFRNKRVCKILSTTPIAEIATKVPAVLGPSAPIGFSCLGLGLGSIVAYCIYNK